MEMLERLLGSKKERKSSLTGLATSAEDWLGEELSSSEEETSGEDSEEDSSIDDSSGDCSLEELLELCSALEDSSSLETDSLSEEISSGEETSSEVVFFSVVATALEEALDEMASEDNEAGVENEQADRTKADSNMDTLAFMPRVYHRAGKFVGETAYG